MKTNKLENNLVEEKISAIGAKRRQYLNAYLRQQSISQIAALILQPTNPEIPFQIAAQIEKIKQALPPEFIRQEMQKIQSELNALHEEIVSLSSND